MKIDNVKGYLYSEDVKVLKKTPEKIIIQGLLLPKDTVSRNGVLYDWESIKDNYKQLLDKPVLYNHLNESSEPPVGKVIETWLKEKDDESGKAGWYYKADINPESKYASSVLRGDLNKVSIQLMASAQKEEKTDDGQGYTRAFVGDTLEMSLVPTPGFIDSNIEIVMAEAFRVSEKLFKEMSPEEEAQFNRLSSHQKVLYRGQRAKGKSHIDALASIGIKYESGQSTGTNPGASATLIPKKKEEALGEGDIINWLKSLDKSPTDSELHAWAEQNGMDVHQVEATMYKFAKQHIDMGHTEAIDDISTNADDKADSEFDPEQLKMGIEVEQEHTDDINLAKQIAKAHLAEIPDYYTRLKKMEDDAKLENNKMAEEDQKPMAEEPKQKEEAVAEAPEVSEEESVVKEEEGMDSPDEKSDMDKMVDIVEALARRVEALENGNEDVVKEEAEDSEEVKEEGCDEEVKQESDDKNSDEVKEEAADTPQTEQEPEQTPKVQANDSPLDIQDKQNKQADVDNIIKNEAADEAPAEKPEEEESEDKPIPPVAENVKLSLNHIKVESTFKKDKFREAAKFLGK